MTIDQIASVIKDTGNCYVRVYAGTRHSRNRLPALNTSDYFGKEEDFDVDRVASIFSRVCSDLPAGPYVVTMKRNRQAKDDTERELYLEIGPQAAPGIAGPMMPAPAANLEQIEARLKAEFQAQLQALKHEQERKELERQIQDLKEEVKTGQTWGAKLSGLLDYAAEAYLPQILGAARQPAMITGFTPEATIPEEVKFAENDIDADDLATQFLGEISEKIGEGNTLELLRKLSVIDADGLNKLIGLSDGKIKGLLMMF